MNKLSVVKVNVEVLMGILSAFAMRDSKFIMMIQPYVLVRMYSIYDYCIPYILLCDVQLSDIDECVKSNGGCQHICKNNIGSYQCLCHNGYSLVADEYSCEGKIIILKFY